MFTKCTEAQALDEKFEKEKFSTRKENPKHVAHFIFIHYYFIQEHPTDEVKNAHSLRRGAGR